MAQTSCFLLEEFWCATGKVWQIMQRNTCQGTVLRSKSRCWTTVVLVELPLGCCQLHLGRKEMQIKSQNWAILEQSDFFSKSSVLTLKNKEGIIELYIGLLILFLSYSTASFPLPWSDWGILIRVHYICSTSSHLCYFVQPFSSRSTTERDFVLMQNL